MLRFFGFLLLFLMMGSLVAVASSFIQQRVPQGKTVGQGILSFAFWDVYQATLYAPQGRWDPKGPFALSLEYYRDLKGADIAQRSIEEMKKQGFNEIATLAEWEKQMQVIFPDVKKGSVLSAVYNPEQGTSFYDGETPIGTIAGRAFAQQFFGIWLAETTSEPDLRQALLGL
jgi:hypothetical protein